MTGTIDLSDQDVQDLVNCIESVAMRHLVPDDLRGRLSDLKERLLKVEVNGP
jgi:hypothetical protein